MKVGRLGCSLLHFAVSWHNGRTVRRGRGPGSPKRVPSPGLVSKNRKGQRLRVPKMERVISRPAVRRTDPRTFSTWRVRRSAARWRAASSFSCYFSTWRRRRSISFWRAASASAAFAAASAAASCVFRSSMFSLMVWSFGSERGAPLYFDVTGTVSLGTAVPSELFTGGVSVGFVHNPWACRAVIHRGRCSCFLPSYLGASVHA